MDTQELLGDWLCTGAGFVPGRTYDSVKEMVFPLLEELGDGMYSSIEVNSYELKLGRTEDEIDFNANYAE